MLLRQIARFANHDMDINEEEKDENEDGQEYKLSRSRTQLSIYETESDNLHKEKLDLVEFLSHLGDKQLLQNAIDSKDFKTAREIK